MHRDINELKKRWELAAKENRLTEVMLEDCHSRMRMAQIWELRSFFYALPEEVFKEQPYLAAYMVQVYVLEGDLNIAKKYLDYTKIAPEIYEPTRLVFPGLSVEEFHDAVRALYKSNAGVQEQLVLTAARPTVLNGFRDFTMYASRLEQNKEQIVSILETIYGEAATGVVEIARAEYLYQRNQCFDALVLVVGTIAFMEDKKDSRCMFAALALEMYILIMNGQAQSAEFLTKKLRRRIERQEIYGLEKNIDALDIRAAMYDGNTEKVNAWMSNGAPDEFNDFNMIDVYRYLTKMRGYLIQQKHMELISLAEKIRPWMKLSERIMDMCEIDILLALCYHDQKRYEEAFDTIAEVLTITKKTGCHRLVGDEGDRMYRLLYDYRQSRGNTPYLKTIMDIARQVGMAHPNYLKAQCNQIDSLSEMEEKVLSLMAEEKTNAEIGVCLDITLNTVKYHSKNIYKKLSVKSRGQAVKKAKEMGIL